MARWRNLSRWLLTCLLLLSTLGGSTFAQTSKEEKQLQLLRRNYADLFAKFEQDMEAVAKRCEELSFLSDAEKIRQRAKPVLANSPQLDDLPPELIPEIPFTLPDEQREWQVRLRKVEGDYSAALYRLAREALNRGHPSLAFGWVREVAYHDPNHRDARKMLGYITKGTRWTTPFALQMENKKFVNDPQFGWIEARNVARYQKGERFYQGAWMSAEKEAALRSDFQHAWEIRSEHFLVKTNVSQERGVELSRALETFHDFFLREFTAFFNSPAQMQTLFDSGTGERAPRNDVYEVYYFKSKAEFVAYLKPRQPGIEAANGVYMPRDRIAYFYHEPNPAAQRAQLGTMYHEVTHQLLGESLPKNVDVGVASDFWVIEGIACYCESFHPDQPQQMIGDPADTRLRWAREYVAVEQNCIPMHQITSYGQKQFPADHLHYSQAAGMAHFFLHAQDGAYRDAFMEYLRQIYSRSATTRAKPKSLADLTGIPFQTLDQQYRDYITTLPAPRPAP